MKGYYRIHWVSTRLLRIGAVELIVIYSGAKKSTNKSMSDLNYILICLNAASWILLYLDCNNDEFLQTQSIIQLNSQKELIDIIKELTYLDTEKNLSFKCHLNSVRDNAMFMKVMDIIQQGMCIKEDFETKFGSIGR